MGKYEGEMLKALIEGKPQIQKNASSNIPMWLKSSLPTCCPSAAWCDGQAMVVFLDCIHLVQVSSNDGLARANQTNQTMSSVSPIKQSGKCAAKPDDPMPSLHSE